MGVPDEGYSRNGTCAQTLISMFLSNTITNIY
jgi:hypothetical protein